MTTPIPILTLFCQLNALSRQQQIRPFDKKADGTILGEGLGVVLLKRAEEAARDGDRIYALLKGAGIASDGRGMGVLAPRVEGAALALRRAYESTGLAPETIGLIEAHGTGTAAGDQMELQVLEQLFKPQGGRPPPCALGSVKSMIGHTMPAAGIAGVIRQVQTFLENNPEITLLDLAYTTNAELREQPYRLALVADSADDLRQKLAKAASRLAESDCHRIQDARGIYFFETPLYPTGTLAFLFPGEGGPISHHAGRPLFSLPRSQGLF